MRSMQLIGRPGTRRIHLKLPDISFLAPQVSNMSPSTTNEAKHSSNIFPADLGYIYLLIPEHECPQNIGVFVSLSDFYYFVYGD